MKPTFRKPMTRAVVYVSAVALVRGTGEVLLARRPQGKPMAGLWEFPGGKIEPGETPEDTLVREVAEELGIEARARDFTPLAFASHAYDGFHLVMPLYVCRAWRGMPVPREGQEFAWAAAGDLGSYPMPAADLPLVPVLQRYMEDARNRG